MHKLEIKTIPWQVYFSLDGETLVVPVDPDNTGYTLEIEGDVYVTLHGQRVRITDLIESQHEATLDRILAAEKATAYVITFDDTSVLRKFAEGT